MKYRTNPLKLLIIIPAFNEEKSLTGLLPEIIKYCPFSDILLIDDGSRDLTSQIAREHEIPVIRLNNEGVGRAMEAGFLYAIENDYDAAIQIDGDGQHDPRWVKELIKPILDEIADCVIGSRFLKDNPDRLYKTPFLRRIGMYYSSVLLFLAGGVYITDTTSGFRVINRKALDLFKTNYPAKYPEAGALFLLLLAGCKIIELPIKMRNRKSGRSMYTFTRSVLYPFQVLIGFIEIYLDAKRKK